MENDDGDDLKGKGRHFKVRDAAHEIGVHPTTLYRWTDQKTVAYRLSAGGVRLVPEAEVQRLKEDVQILKEANGGHLPRNPVKGRRAKAAKMKPTQTEPQDPNSIDRDQYRAETYLARAEESGLSEEQLQEMRDHGIG